MKKQNEDKNTLEKKRLVVEVKTIRTQLQGGKLVAGGCGDDGAEGHSRYAM
jgi:hypothetical protein